MIYNEEFIKYLKDYLDPVQIKARNIVCRCPFCEMNDEKKSHYHLWISTEVPIFHCFHSICHKSGTISTLMRKLTGRDLSDKFVDQSKIKKSVTLEEKQKSIFHRTIELPDIDFKTFSLKTMYLKQRMKFSNNRLELLSGLIFDVEKFIEINRIQLDEKQKNMLPFLQSNFIGFLTEHQSTVVFRNIDQRTNFRYYKIPIQTSPFSDYYKLKGYDIKSNDVIIGEGIFDILTEHIFDYTNLQHGARLYAAALSTHYSSTIKSLVFHEQIFRPNIYILSDNGIDLNYYKKIKKENHHIINSLKVYYNKNGKDFNDTPVKPVSFNL